MTTDPGPVAELLATELVAIDSVNPGLVPGAAGETAIIARLQHRLAAAGFATKIVAPPGQPARPSLLAWHLGPPTAPTLLLNGHVDTVGVEGMPEPFTPRVVGHILHGRGAADMKGGVAGLVAAAEVIAHGGHGSVVLALVADEEDASLGTKAVIGELPTLGLRPDVALVGEPSGLDRTAGLRGFTVLEVVFTGRAAHSSQPAEGVNAISHVGRFLTALDAAGAELAPTGRSLMATTLKGGSAPFTIPARAQVVVERRTTPGESAAVALVEVETILHRLRAEDPAVDGSAQLLIAREPWELDGDGPAATFAGLLDDALAGAPGRTGEPFHAPYWMEAPLWQAAGIPALVCGPTGGGLHALDEWVDLRQVAAFARGIVTAYARWAAEREG